jgi:hypothetical protein
MPDAIEEAKSAAFTLDTRSVYTRIGNEPCFVYPDRITVRFSSFDL